MQILSSFSVHFRFFPFALHPFLQKSLLKSQRENLIKISRLFPASPISLMLCGKCRLPACVCVCVRVRKFRSAGAELRLRFFFLLILCVFRRCVAIVVLVVVERGCRSGCSTKGKEGRGGEAEGLLVFGA